MAIETSIRLNDGMSQTMQNMLKNISRIIDSLKKVDGVNLNGLRVAQNSISRATNNLINGQDEFQRELMESNDKLTQLGTNGAKQGNSIASSIKRAAIALGGLYAVKQGINLADDITMMDARLNLNLDKGQTLDNLKNQIFEMSQNSRGDFLVNIDAVAKLKTLAGDAFGSNSEIIKFQELLNKQLTIGGADETAKKSTVLQLTQAMASGRLQGDEYRSLSENNPLLIKSIAESLKVSRGELKKMSSDGLITAEIIKKAMFDSAQSIDEQFKTMPMTFGQSMTKMKNEFVMNFGPVAKELSNIFNSENFMQSISIISVGLGGIVLVIANVVKAFGGLANIIINNFDIIGPIIALGAIGWGAYALAVNAATIASKANAVAQWIGSAALAVKNTALLIGAGVMALFTGATVAQTAAQWGINSALYACPIVWVIAAIVALVAIVYLVVAAFNKWSGTTYSATGIIVGAFSAVSAAIYNGVIFIINIISVMSTNIYNQFIFIAETMVNLFKNPGQTLKRLFFDIASFILDKMSTVVKVMDKVLGTNYGDKIKGLSDSIQNFADEKMGEKEFKMERKVAKTFEYKDPRDAFKSGYKTGDGLGNKISSMKNKFSDNGNNAFLKNIDRNTEATAKGIDLTTDEIKYMRDVAEQEVVNRYTTASITNNNSFQNSIKNGMDIDSVVSAFSNGMNKASETVAHGNY